MSYKSSFIRNYLRMKKLIILLFITLMCWNGTFSSNKYSQSVQDKDPSVIWKKRTYSISNDSVNAVLNVVQYSKAIIDYEITIVTSKGKIEQKGYALCLGAEIIGGVEHESDENGKDIQVIPYNSYLCGCQDKYIFEIRIATDKKKVSIYSTRKLRHELFNDKMIEGQKLIDSVQLFGYLYLKD